MTLVDYSFSNVVFDEVKRYKDTLKDLVIASNQTGALGALIPNLEEFIDVAQSEWFCFPQKIKVYQHWNDKRRLHICFISESWLATTIFASLNSVAYTLHVLACYR